MAATTLLVACLALACRVNGQDQDESLSLLQSHVGLQDAALEQPQVGEDHADAHASNNDDDQNPLGIRLFTTVFDLSEKKSDMVVASLRSLRSRTSAPVEVFCRPEALCDKLSGSVHNIKFTHIQNFDDNWVVDIEMVKRSYLQNNSGGNFMWFETDMIFLSNPVTFATERLSQATNPCDVIIQYGNVTHMWEAEQGGINTGIMFFHSGTAALNLIQKTIDGLLQIQQSTNIHCTGGENQAVLADMGFDNIAPGSSRNRFGITVCSDSLDAIQLHNLDYVKLHSLDPLSICKEAKETKVSVIHFDAKRQDADKVKGMLVPTQKLLEGSGC